MGQTASRHASEQTTTPSSSSRPSEPTSSTDPPISNDNRTRSQKRSSKSSFRQSILSVVRPRGDASSSRDDNLGESKARRLWRNSRRWSKSRTESDTGPSVLGVQSSAPEHDLPPTIPEKPSEQPVRPAESSTLSTTELQTERQVLDVLESPVTLNERPCEHLPQLESHTPEASGSGNLPSSITNDPLPHHLLDNTFTTSDAPTNSVPATQELPPPVPFTPSQPQARQFPPPGTLVVVQGVVHTSDAVTRPPTSGLDTSPTAIVERSSDPNDPNPPQPGSRPLTPAGSERARSRLSSLLRPRPASTSNSRPTSVWDDHTNTPISPPSSSTQPSTSNTTDIPHPAADDPLTSQTDAQNASSDPVTPFAQSPRTISSSSIDVLGTLLSVAAAATAASLLTGSTEPVMSNGLSPVNSPLFSRPQSGAAGTGFLDSPHFQTDANMSRSERMRNVWGSFRERFGLRGNPAFPLGHETTNQPNVDIRGQPDGTSLDPREMMLAEMARAFNAGLGLSDPGNQNPSSTSSTPQPPSTDPPAPNQLPPEGSFERFLVDLQVDLRIALTRSSGAPSDTGPDMPSAFTESQPTNSETSPHQFPSHSPSRAPSPNPRQPVDHEDNTDGLPPLETIVDSDSEVDGVEEAVEPDTEASAVDDEATRPLPTDLPGSQANLPGRINWWRFYRFPAIPAPRTPHPFTAPTATPPSTSNTPSDQTTVPSPSVDEPLGTGGTPNPQPSRENPPMVIPVVVVGLQSVNAPTWHPDPPPDDQFLDEGATPGHPDDLPLSHVQEPDPDALPGSADPFNRNVRGRSWHARAANVLRNLRPGRRSPSPPRLPGDAAGSRTFLIYVIGGYYPPDHNIVTQTFNDFESFEALLQLAELLGQVKPPTVSKEDIDKSGLQIIQPSQLQEFVLEGKISSNCTDRCLVCLDDYAPEDEIRVMACKHAFHKSCVDRWLQTGRNNCPACRSKGVSTEETRETIPGL